MGYLVFELIVYLLIAAAIGVAIGLYVHHAFFAEKQRRDLDDTTREARAAEQEVVDLQRQLKAAKKARKGDDAAAKPTPSTEGADGTEGADDADVAQLRARIAELENEHEGLVEMQEATAQRIESLLAENKTLSQPPPPPIDEAEEEAPESAPASAAVAEARRLRDQLGQRSDKQERVASDLRNAQRQLKRMTNDLSKRETEAEEYEQRIAQLVEMLDKRDADVDEHVSRLARVSSTGDQLSKLRKDLSALQKVHEGCDRSVTELKEQVTAAQQQHSECDATIAGLRTALESAREAAGAAVAAAPEWILREPQNGRGDDLKKIHGIGPKLAGLLNDMGIYHFWQIAQLSPSDEEHVAGHIKTFPDRIRRDQWVRQAAELAQTSAASAPAPPPSDQSAAQ